MSKPNADLEPIAPEIVDQAISWFVKLSSGSATHEEYAACAQWRAVAPAHERAWQRLERIAQTAQHGAKAAPLSRATLVDVADQQLSRRQVLKKSILLLGLVGGSAWLARQSIPWAFYLADIHTNTAGRRELKLADGSQLLLDAVSAINIDPRAKPQRIELVSGRLLVTTSTNPTRSPLQVTTADGILIPHGTRFSVRRYADDTRTQLVVIDGAVTVRPTDGVGATRIEAGWQTTLSRGATGPVEPLQPLALSWIDGILRAENTRLDDFIAELSRYRWGLLLVDPAVADLRLTGTFPLYDSDRVLQLLPQTLAVRVRSITRYWVNIEAR